MYYYLIGPLGKWPAGYGVRTDKLTVQQLRSPNLTVPRSSASIKSGEIDKRNDLGLRKASFFILGLTCEAFI